MTTIGLILMLNYLGRYQNLTDIKHNGAQLTLSLIQQFGRWADVTNEYLNRHQPIYLGLPIDAIVGTPTPGAKIIDNTNTEVGYIFDPESLEAESRDPLPKFSSESKATVWLKTQEKQSHKEANKRRLAAKNKLDTSLSAMPHNRMIYILGEIAASHFQHPDARLEASRRLNKHQQTCMTCKGAKQ